MQRKYFGLFAVLLLCLNGTKADPTSFPDVEPIDPPKITLRSVNTGEPLRNNQYHFIDPRNAQWELDDINTPEFGKFRDGGSFVQFKVPETSTPLCLNHSLGVSSCSQLQTTVFSLIPTNSGAVAIKEVEKGFCLMSFNYRDYSFRDCGKTLRNQLLDFPSLWFISAPFGRPKLLIPPTK